jgi:alpha-beta hydrolase superfamily lysophospholipase
LVRFVSIPLGAILVWSLAVASCATSHRVSVVVHETPRADSSTLVWLSKEPAGQATYPVVLFLDGSGCASVVRVLPYAQGVIDIGFAVAAPEKRGVAVDDDGKSCSREFLDTNDCSQRLADAELLVSQLPSRFPRWNGKLIVIGGSEGAGIAPEVAARHRSETAALVLMGGGGWDQATELLALAKQNGEDAGALEAQFAAMERDPTPTRSWLGEANTYKRWASCLRGRPLDFLLQVDAPIYMVNGGRDDRVPVASAEAVVVAFREHGKTNLTYREWPGLNHRWIDADGKNHLHEVGAALIAWLQTVVPG